jgi:hypothetical protein
MHNKPLHLLTLALGVALLSTLLACSGFGPERAYCETAGDCDDGFGLFDPVQGSSDDSVDVCTVNQETNIAALRANSEEVCHDLADAWQAYMLCAVEEGCDAFNPLEPECNDELEDVADLSNDAGNRCSE